MDVRFYMKFDVKRILNTLNIRIIKINNHRIISIESYNNTSSRVVKYVIVDINKYKVLIPYKINKDIVLNSKRLLQIIKSFI